MNFLKRALTGFLLAFISYVYVLLSPAQISSQSGAITGRVADPAEASLLNAVVSLRAGNGVVRVQKTGASGEFMFPFLDPGIYSLAASAAGFGAATYRHIAVEVTQTTRLKINLQPGATTTQVNVADSVMLVNTSSPALGYALSGPLIEDLPLATRNFTNLTALNANTNSTLPNAAVAGRGSAVIYVNGQRGTANNLVINGIDANNIANDSFGNVATPSPDSLEEFRVQTSLYDASEGRTSGANINAIIRSGGALYHAEFYEYFRNDSLNANSFFFNRAGTPRPELRQNQFGGNFAGPAPKLSKTYFFVSFERTRQTNALSGAIVGLFPVFPAQRTEDNIEHAFGLRPGSLSPVALKLLNARGVYNGMLMPSGTGAPVGQFGNLTLPDPLTFNDTQFNANGDRQLTRDNRLLLRFFRSGGSTFDALGGEGAQSLGSGLTTPSYNYLSSIGDTWALTPHLTNEARLGFDRNTGGSIPNEPVSLADVGMTRFNQTLFPGIPYIVTNDPIADFGGVSTNFDQRYATNTYHAADTAAWIHGKHAIRVGFEYRRYQVNAFNNFASRGYLQFASFSNFLTGGPIATSFVGSGLTVRDFRARDLSAYAEDDYRITPRMTVNLGVRYDYFGPFIDRLDRLANFDPSRLDGNTFANGGPGLASGFVLPAAYKGPSIQGTPGVDPSTLTNLNKTNFAPRAGIAWDPFGSGRTAIRAGYGIYYIRTSSETQLQLLTAEPFFETSNLVNPAATLANPFPALPLPSQFPILPAFPQFTGYSAAGVPQYSAGLLTLNPIERNLPTPYAEQYNVTVQRDLPARFNIEAGYVGSRGVHLLNSLDVNQALLANAAGPIRGLTANSTANYNARVTVAGLSPTGLNEVTDAGHSSYNALVVTLNRRFGGVFLQVAYTLSMSIDNNSGSATQDLGTQVGNQLIPSLARGLSDFDRTHRVQITWNYDLKPYGSGWMRKASGGWSAGGLTTYQSAPPIQFTCASCSALTNVYGIDAGLSPDLIGNFTKLDRRGDPRRYLDAGASEFNPGILAIPTVFTGGQALGTNLNSEGGSGNQTYTVGGSGAGIFEGQLFGTLPRNPGLRGQFQQQWDVYVAKDIPLTEKLRIRFDGQMFNALNHPVFAAPSGAVGSAAFGRVTSTVTQPRIVQLAARIQF